MGKILIPSEETRIEAYPMDHQEFCDAVGYNYGVLIAFYFSDVRIGEATNRILIRNFRTYVAVGGMPQAVSAFVERKNCDEIDRIKKGSSTFIKTSSKRSTNPAGFRKCMKPS